MLLGSGKAIFVMGIFQLESYLNYTGNFCACLQSNTQTHL
jgi:hypothetical protein